MTSKPKTTVACGPACSNYATCVDPFASRFPSCISVEAVKACGPACSNYATCVDPFASRFPSCICGGEAAKVNVADAIETAPSCLFYPECGCSGPAACASRKSA